MALIVENPKKEPEKEVPKANDTSIDEALDLLENSIRSTIASFKLLRTLLQNEK